MHDNALENDVMSRLKFMYIQMYIFYFICTKHEFCVMRPNLCRTTKIEAFQFVLYDQI
jgi:hypothetical protein